MIGKRIVALVGALGMAAATISAVPTAASAAGVGIYFGVPGAYNYPPPNRACWRWSRQQHQWVCLYVPVVRWLLTRMD